MRKKESKPSFPAPCPVSVMRRNTAPACDVRNSVEQILNDYIKHKATMFALYVKRNRKPGQPYEEVYKRFEKRFGKLKMVYESVPVNGNPDGPAEVREKLILEIKDQYK